MVTFPCCKINLGLHVVSKRADGYHNIQTCFYPVPWTDILEIIPARQSEFSFSGISISGKVEDNLCVRAYALLLKDFKLPPIKLHLHKIIPAGAGLGGGSSDAAATLDLLNKIFELNMGIDHLRTYAIQLGSDSPFFLSPEPMLGEGKGEILRPWSGSLKGKFLVVIYPNIHSSTVDAYRHVAVRRPARALEELLNQPLREWRTTIVNDFEQHLFGKHPDLAGIRDDLYQRGAQYAGMSGSGSAIFGLFDDSIDVSSFSRFPTWCGRLLQ